MAQKPVPKYRKQKRSNRPDLAFVEIDGRRVYLGEHGSPESRQAYARAVAEFGVDGGQGRTEPSSITIVEAMARYWRHVETYYVKDGQPTSEVESIRQALRPLLRLYGRMRVAEFSPLKLKTVRIAYVDADNCRNTVNRQTQRVRQAFKWLAENELAPASVYHALATVNGLRRGRANVRESEPVRPVPDEHVDALEPFVLGAIWTAIQIQRLTGMRSGELLSMRGCDLNMDGDLWIYTPRTHKSEHHGFSRVIELGPRAQEVLRPLLNPDLAAHLFRPMDAIAERAARFSTHRRPDQAPKPRKTARRVRDYYDANSYRRAIQRACELAGVSVWHPHQLRHNYATAIRRAFGIELARVMLGHRSAVTSELYAEVDRSKAREVVAKIG